MLTLATLLTAACWSGRCDLPQNQTNPVYTLTASPSPRDAKTKLFNGVLANRRDRRHAAGRGAFQGCLRRFFPKIAERRNHRGVDRPATRLLRLRDRRRGLPHDEPPGGSNRLITVPHEEPANLPLMPNPNP